MRPSSVVANCGAGFLGGQLLESHEGPAFKFIKNKHLEDDDDEALRGVDDEDSDGIGNTKASWSPAGTFEGLSPSPSRGAEETAAAADSGDDASSCASRRRRTTGSFRAWATCRAAGEGELPLPGSGVAKTSAKDSEADAFLPGSA